MLKDILLTPEIIDGLIKILGLGLAGFGFLQMYLAYSLIKKIIDSKNEKLLVIIKTVNLYMALCLVMTLVMALFTFFNARYKLYELTQKDSIIEFSSNAFRLVEASRLNTGISDSLLRQSDSRAKVQVLSKAQKTVLDTITVLISKSNNEESKEQFKVYKSQVLILGDSLANAPRQTPNQNLLKLKYRCLNDTLQTLVDTVAARFMQPAKNSATTARLRKLK